MRLLIAFDGGLGYGAACARHPDDGKAWTGADTVKESSAVATERVSEA